MLSTPTRTVHVNEAFSVQTEPLLADEWTRRLIGDGCLVSVVEVDHDAFVGAIEIDHAEEMLARAQAVHTEPYLLDWRIVGVGQESLYVRVSNNLLEWAADPENVDTYNATVPAEHRLTAERLTGLGIR